MHDLQHWLPLVADLQVVGLVEVLGYTDLLAISHVEEGVARSKIKLDILNDVRPFVAVVGDDA